MRAVVLVLVLGLVGCHSKRAKYAVAGGTIAGGVYLIAVAPAKESCDFAPDPDDPFGIGSVGCEVGQSIRATFLWTGILAVATGLLTLALVSRSDTPPTTTSQLDDKIVTRLTAQAALAARSGDCSTTRELVARIARRDTTVVLDDPAISRCLP